MGFPGNYNHFQSKVKRFSLLILAQKYLVFPLFPTIVLHHFPQIPTASRRDGEAPPGSPLNALPPSCRACGQQAPPAVSSSDLNQPLSLGSVAGDSARCHGASRFGLPGRRACSLPRSHAVGQGLARPVSSSSFPANLASSLALHRPRSLINK